MQDFIQAHPFTVILLLAVITFPYALLLDRIA
jgi:hypothetical protein